MRQSFLLSNSSEIFKEISIWRHNSTRFGNCPANKDKVFTVSTIKRLAKRFPQIELDFPDSLHLLAQEFTDFLLLLKTFLLLGITKIVMKWRNYVLGFFGGKLVR